MTNVCDTQNCASWPITKMCSNFQSLHAQLSNRYNISVVSTCKAKTRPIYLRANLYNNFGTVKYRTSEQLPWALYISRSYTFIAKFQLSPLLFPGRRSEVVRLIICRCTKNNHEPEMSDGNRLGINVPRSPRVSKLKVYSRMKSLVASLYCGGAFTL